MNFSRAHSRVQSERALAELVLYWHGSFSSMQKSYQMIDLQSAIGEAKVARNGRTFAIKFTLVHVGQTSEWFETWVRQLFLSEGVVVVYSNEYRRRFTEPLMMEAAAILKLLEDKAIKCYIFDPDIDSASDVMRNIQRNTPVMGNLAGWKEFVQTHSDAAAVAKGRAAHVRD